MHKKMKEKTILKCKEICNGKEFQLLPICAFGIQQKRREANWKGDQKKRNKMKAFIYKKLKENNLILQLSSNIFSSV